MRSGYKFMINRSLLQPWANTVGRTNRCAPSSINVRPLLIILLLCVAANPIKAQERAKKDTTIILISDLHVQLECSQALNDLYNFKFPQAEHQFEYLKSRFPWHPLPYFLMGLIEWFIGTFWWKAFTMPYGRIKNMYGSSWHAPTFYSFSCG